MLGRKQKGVGLSGLLIWAFILVLGAIGGMKVVPAVIEYFTIVKNVKAMTADGQLNNASVTDIRNAFDRRASVAYITDISGADLDISKNGNEVVIEFAYTKKIPLGGPVSLNIDFVGSSAGKDKGD